MTATIVSNEIVDHAAELAEIVADWLTGRVEEDVLGESLIVIHSDRAGDTDITEVDWEIEHGAGLDTTDPHRVVIYRPDGTAFVHVEAWYNDDNGAGYLAQGEIAADGTVGAIRTREF